MGEIKNCSGSNVFLKGGSPERGREPKRTLEMLCRTWGLDEEPLVWWPLREPKAAAPAQGSELTAEALVQRQGLWHRHRCHNHQLPQKEKKI